MNEQQEQMINTQEATPNKKSKMPIIICGVSVVILIAAIAVAAIVNNSGSSNGDNDAVVVVDDDESDSWEDPEELNAFIDSVEYTDDMDFEQLQASLVKAGWTEPDENDDSSDISDDYCGDGDKKSIDMEWTDDFFGAYTDHGARAILNTIYGYFKTVYPEFDSVSIVEDSWYGSTFKIEASDGTVFSVNAATKAEGNLLDVTKVSIYTEDDQQIFVRNIAPNNDAVFNVPMTSDLSEDEAVNIMSGLVGEDDEE